MNILIAKDEAFSFMYQANIDALARLGRISFFSPLADSCLPPCDFLYLPGGYPELFAEKLAANTSMRLSVKSYAERGGRLLAECGGFIYLCSDLDGIPMCDVLPLQATMSSPKLHLGYRQMLVGDTIIRGHEFHYSSVIQTQLPADVRCVMQQQSAMGTPVPTALYRYKNVVAGYTHWYWAETSIHTLWNI